MNNLTVFLPIFNEEENIRQVVADAVAFLASNTDDYEVLLINDGSTDGTLSILQLMAVQNEKLKIIDHKVNRGYGAAIKTGITNATHDWIFFMDSDGQFDIRELSNFFAHKDESDLIIGYRHNRDDGAHRILLSNLYKAVVGKIFGLRIKDIDCAFKLMRSSKVRELNLMSTSFSISTELLFKSMLGGHVITELPVMHLPRTAGKSTVTLKRTLLSLVELLVLYKALKVKRQ